MLSLVFYFPVPYDALACFAPRWVERIILIVRAYVAVDAGQPVGEAIMSLHKLLVPVLSSCYRLDEEYLHLDTSVFA